VSQLASLEMPDIRRTDVASVLVGQRYVSDRAKAQSVLEQTTAAWQNSPWPAGILSASCYLSTDEDTVLTYVQCRAEDSHRALAEALRGPAGAGVVEYRLRSSVVPQGTSGVPACMVIATFDVDSAERQDRIIGSLVEALDRAPDTQPPGMLSANFHASTDATRVLNYAEWTSDEAHLAFLDSAVRSTTMRVSGDVPGVRPIGFKRYHLFRSLSR
jgi:Antibiotic biosynthesis monooxygenase